MVYIINQSIDINSIYETMMREKMDLYQYIHESTIDLYHIQLLQEADDNKEKLSSKIWRVIKGWLDKIIQLGKTIKNFIVSFFKKIRDKFKGKKISSFTPFEDYNYKDFINNKLRSLDFLLYDGDEPNPKNTVDVIKQWTGEQYSYSDFVNNNSIVINTNKCVEYLLGKKIKIDEKYMSANAANSIIGSSIEEDLTSVFENKINQCRKLANDMKKSFDQNNADSMNLLLSNTLKINTKLFNTSTDIIAQYMKQLQKIVSSSKSSNNGSKKKYQFKLTKAFYDAVESGNVNRVRIMMNNAMILDPTLVHYNDMEKAVVSMDGLYEEYDGKELIWDKNQWDNDYMDMMMVKVLNNFSHKRLDHLKQIVQYLYKDTIKEIEDSRK